VPTSADTSERRHNVLRTRREWSVAEKRAIVAETRLPGANISAISRRHGAAQSLIYQWRKLFPATGTGSAFLPVTIATSASGNPPSPAKPAMIEIELAFGRKLRVASDIDAAVLRRIIVALETA
jgi:transposase